MPELYFLPKIKSKVLCRQTCLSRCDADRCCLTEGIDASIYRDAIRGVMVVV